MNIEWLLLSPSPISNFDRNSGLMPLLQYQTSSSTKKWPRNLLKSYFSKLSDQLYRTHLFLNSKHSSERCISPNIFLKRGGKDFIISHVMVKTGSWRQRKLMQLYGGESVEDQGHDRNKISAKHRPHFCNPRRPAEECTVLRNLIRKSVTKLVR
jgi:hypothetical protein